MSWACFRLVSYTPTRAGWRGCVLTYRVFCSWKGQGPARGHTADRDLHVLRGDEAGLRRGHPLAIAVRLKRNKAESAATTKRCSWAYSMGRRHWVVANGVTLDHRS